MEDLAGASRVIEKVIEEVIEGHARVLQKPDKDSPGQTDKSPTGSTAEKGKSREITYIEEMWYDNRTSSARPYDNPEVIYDFYVGEDTDYLRINGESDINDINLDNQNILVKSMAKYMNFDVVK